MSGISSGIGLISGINTSELIEQLMALERRPVQVLEQRVQQIDARKAAFLSLSAQMLAIRNSAANFNKPSFFNRFNANSSHPSLLTARATENAIPSTTRMRVHSLVTNHALISRGFADADRTPIGSGVITIEPERARVNRATELDVLNGGEGIRRGVMRITDRSGASADIDLSTALTVDDVLEAINTNTAISVRASVTGVTYQRDDGSSASGDRVVIEDTSSGTGSLSVIDINGGFMAQDFGIAGTSTTGRIDGHDVMRLDMNTPLALLNDGNGVARLTRGRDITFDTTYGSFNVSLGDLLDPGLDLRQLNSGRGVRLGVISITDRAGNSVEIDLGELAEQGPVTVQDVRTKITQETQNAGVSVSITMVNSSFLITDTSTPSDPDAKLVIQDVSGFAASDLGISTDGADGGFTGRPVYRVSTVGDVIRAINFAPGNDAQVEASIAADGSGIALRAFGFDNEVTVRAGINDDGSASTAAQDLGLLDAAFSTSEAFSSRRLVAGLNTVLLQTLRGGRGVTAGSVSMTDRSGQTAEIDFSAAHTLRDVVDLINASDLAIRARFNASGNGIEIVDESNGSGPIEIHDITGSLAADLGIEGVFDANDNSTVNSGNLQAQYISRSTLLSSLNAGRGITLGSIRITDSTDAVYNVDLPANLRTVGEVVDAITRGTPASLHARINDNGDGIIVTDESSGSKALTIIDVSGRAAAGLRLAGSARSGENFIDGSYETRIEIGAGDTLNDLARKVNLSGIGVSASVINSGAANNPFSLTLTSEASGRRGEVLFDAQGVDIGMRTLSRARDAVVTLGGGEGGESVLISSSTNQLSNVIEGVTFDLLGTSDEVITVSVGRNVDGIVESIQTFVSAYNSAIDAIAENTSFNQETFARGSLFGDSTVSTINARLRSVMLRDYAAAEPSLSRLFNIGLRLGSGGRLEFNEDRFRQTYEDSPEAVESLFTKSETGFGAVLSDSLDEVTRNFDGLLARKSDLLNDQKELLNNRITSLNVLLDAKRSRLEAQFVALETALAGLQGQQNALANLSQLASQ
jgi:flagellar hook-associated protein 2